MNKPIKVVIVDDHVMVREGLKKMLTTESELEVIGEAGNGKEALKVVCKLAPDVVVLDISMPEMGGLEAISLLREAAPKTKIVVLSMHGKETLAQEALRSGASAYILKGDCGDELISAIHAVHMGNYYFSAQLRSAMVSSYIGGPKVYLSKDVEKYETLSDRERQYFRLMLTGSSTEKISQTLGISCKTGQKHRTSVVKKLGVGNPIDMVKLAMKLGLFDPGMADET